MSATCVCCYCRREFDPGVGTQKNACFSCRIAHAQNKSDLSALEVQRAIDLADRIAFNFVPPWEQERHSSATDVRERRKEDT